MCRFSRNLLSLIRALRMTGPVRMPRSMDTFEQANSCDRIGIRPRVPIRFTRLMRSHHHPTDGFGELDVTQLATKRVG